MSDASSPLGNFKSQDAPTYESVLQCMRCGFCLPTCPTYALTGRERSSPRGRVALARAVAEGQLEFTPAVEEEAFFCLDCRACTTACPSGVRAGEVMETCRAQAQSFFPLSGWHAVFREFVLQKMLPSPELLERSMLPSRLYQRLGIQWLVRHSHLLKLAPKWAAKAEGMLPRLSQTARRLALHNLDLFMELDVDAIVTDCAGCGAALKEYEELLTERADHERLAAFRAKVRDISEFLVGAGLRTGGLKEVRRTVTYHEPCHLCHAQGVSAQPRQLIRAIPGVELREMQEASWCCGSAATWGLKFSEESEKVLDRKLGNLAATGAEILVTGNPGCHLQLAWGLRARGMKQEVRHVMELLGEAVPD
ncbi:MAG: (Fe-S)-binding protein [Desulfuromonadales bacterium]